MGGLIIYHSLTLCQKIWSLKKMAYFLEINVKWLIIQGVKKSYCQTSCAFLAIFKGPSRKKTDAASSNQLYKFILKCGLGIIYFSFKIKAMGA